MKVAVRGGHNFSARGASGLIDETTEDRKVKDSVISLLKNNGIEVLDCTSPDSCNTVSSDLVYGVNKANSWGADLFVSIHFNNAYNSYNGKLGTETIVYSGFDIAQRIVNKIAGLGFVNRGMKNDVRGLYELKNTNMKAVIVECCFVEATEDVALYKKVGADGIAKAIVEGILNTNLSNKVETPKTNTSNPNYNNLIEYQAHVQSIGWQDKKHGGEIAGTTGQAKRLEALTIKWEGKGNLYFEGHIQNIGWTATRVSGEVIGTINEALRLEAIKIWLEGSDRKLKYRVHIQSKGWTNWLSEKEIAGTTGESLRIEAIEIKVE